VFITWDEKATTHKGTTTRRGTVATRAAGDDAVYQVTSMTREGKAFAKVGVKLGSKRLVTDHVVPATKVNGSVLALVRSLQAADAADETLLPIEAEAAHDGVAPVVDSSGEHVGDVPVDDVGDSVGVILPADTNED
jgi:hypothetical protein